MEKYSKEYFRKLANDIMFDLSDAEIEELQDEFQTMIKQMEILDEIDTDGVATMVYPFEDATTYLRDDVVSNTITQADALKNAPKQREGQIVVPKVVG